MIPLSGLFKRYDAPSPDEGTGLVFVGVRSCGLAAGGVRVDHPERFETMLARYDTPSPDIGALIVLAGCKRAGANTHRGKGDEFGNSNVDQKKGAGFIG